MSVNQNYDFRQFFSEAVGWKPFEFQERFADRLDRLPSLVNIPTGLGKTAMVVIGWLWRRLRARDEVRRQTPQRLVYCLPMRVLVEQTRDNAIRWLHNLQVLGGRVTFDPPLNSGACATLNHRIEQYTPRTDDLRKVPVYVLMGGGDEDDWDIHPEHDAIIIGTQDMLLSRALNRGYAASRARWPMQFGLLHTDCLWVFDEIQLMGSGLATTAQLEAFRHMLGTKDGHGCLSVWMSATMQPDWLTTVDFKDRVGDLLRLDLDDEDRKNDDVKRRWNATKPLKKATATMGDAAALAQEILQAHKPSTRTIVVVNTVKRACELHDALSNASSQMPASTRRGSRKKGLPPTAESDRAGASKPRIALLHSRFRPPDRAGRIADALADIGSGDPGTIIVSTQVIEAGVDVSAATLFTELAPWASLVQRFGRCNRRGEENEHASVWWIDVPAKNADAEKMRHPYELEDLRASAEELKKLTDVGLQSLDQHRRGLTPEQQKALFPHEHTHVIRRKDLIDLFDTTPDLAGNDIDIDRFIREVEDSDVRVFWRDYGDPKKGATPNDVNRAGRNGGTPRVEAAPRRDELCSAPVGEFREFAKRHGGRAWRWNFTERCWERADETAILPGQVYLVHADAGGYHRDRGWDARTTKRVQPLDPGNETPDANEDDQTSWIGVWQTIAQHTDEVCSELDRITITSSLDDATRSALRAAARWHDSGKRHEVFQKALPDGVGNTGSAWAKAAGPLKRYERRHFRHELASALAVLLAPEDLVPADQRDLVAYLVAAHHGKVRLSIRSLPNETRPDARGNAHDRPWRFARGVWDGDVLPAADLGGGVTAPEVTLSLEPMELGLCEHPPFASQPSWAERMIRLRDALGPFRLAYLEAILRAADIRASVAAEQRAATNEAVSSVADAKEAGDG